MEGTLFDFIIKIIDAISTVLTAFVVVSGFIFAKRVMSINETIYGKEAEDRYKEIKSRFSCESIIEPYGGSDQKITPQLEIKKIPYDPQTMPSSWKGTKKNIRYYYEDNGIKMVERWRLKW